MRYVIALIVSFFLISPCMAESVIIGGQRPGLSEELGTYMTSGVIGTGLTGSLSFGVPNVNNSFLASGEFGEDNYAIWNFGTPPTGNYIIKDLQLINVNGSEVQDIVGIWCNGDETIENVWAIFVPIGTQDTSYDLTADIKCSNNIMVVSFNGITYGINIQYILQNNSMSTSSSIDIINYDQNTGQIFMPFLDFLMVMIVFVFTVLLLWFLYYTVYKKHKLN